MTFGDTDTSNSSIKCKCRDINRFIYFVQACTGCDLVLVWFFFFYLWNRNNQRMGKVVSQAGAPAGRMCQVEQNGTWKKYSKSNCRSLQRSYLQWQISIHLAGWSPVRCSAWYPTGYLCTWYSVDNPSPSHIQCKFHFNKILQAEKKCLNLSLKLTAIVKIKYSNYSNLGKKG